MVPQDEVIRIDDTVFEGSCGVEAALVDMTPHTDSDKFYATTINTNVYGWHPWSRQWTYGLKSSLVVQTGYNQFQSIETVHQDVVWGTDWDEVWYDRNNRNLRSLLVFWDDISIDPSFLPPEAILYTDMELDPDHYEFQIMSYRGNNIPRLPYNLVLTRRRRFSMFPQATCFCP